MKIDSVKNHWMTGPLISGLLAAACFPPFNFYWLAFFSLIPLFWSLSTIKKKPFYSGCLFGAVLHGSYHSWILELNAFESSIWVMALWIIYTLLLSSIYGAITWSISTNAWKGAFQIASIWSLAEYIKGLGPFGSSAAALGYTQAYNGWVNPILNSIGTYGLTFLIVVINISLLHLIQTKERTQSTLTVLILLISLGMYSQFFYNKIDNLSSIPVAIIQPNISQTDKLNPSKHDEIEKKLTQLLENVKTEDGIVAFPETIIPRNNLNDTSWMKALSMHVEKTKNTVLFGTLTIENTQLFNSIVMVDPIASPHIQHKIKRMPFGEYLPFRTFIDSTPFKNLIQGQDFSAGTEYDAFKTKYGLCGPSICLEAIYPELYEQLVNKGSSFFILASNSAWFFNSSASEKLFTMAIHRAIEQNRYIMSSSNTGITGIITNTGTYSKLPTDKPLIHETYIDPIESKTLYNKLGDLIIPMSSIIIIISRLKRPSRSKK